MGSPMILPRERESAMDFQTPKNAISMRSWKNLIRARNRIEINGKGFASGKTKEK